MAFRKISSYGYIADSVADLEQLPKAILGAECYVIDEGVEYKCKSDGTWVKPAAAGSNDASGSVDLTGYATEQYVQEQVSAIEVPSVEGLASEAYVDAAIIAATHVEDIYGEAHMFGLMVDSTDNKTLVEAMLEKGKGMYNFHVEKGSPGLPDAVVAKNSSCRGICCVDTVKPTGWYGWIIMLDQDGDMYVQYIRNAEPKGWKQVAFV